MWGVRCCRRSVECVAASCSGMPVGQHAADATHPSPTWPTAAALVPRCVRPITVGGRILLLLPVACSWLLQLLQLLQQGRMRLGGGWRGALRLQSRGRRRRGLLPLPELQTHVAAGCAAGNIQAGSKQSACDIPASRLVTRLPTAPPIFTIIRNQHSSKPRLRPRIHGCFLDMPPHCPGLAYPSPQIN